MLAVDSSRPRSLREQHFVNVVRPLIQPSKTAKKKRKVKGFQRAGKKKAKGGFGRDKVIRKKFGIEETQKGLDIGSSYLEKGQTKKEREADEFDTRRDVVRSDVLPTIVETPKEAGITKKEMEENVARMTQQLQDVRQEQTRISAHDHALIDLRLAQAREEQTRGLTETERSLSREIRGQSEINMRAMTEMGERLHRQYASEGGRVYTTEPTHPTRSRMPFVQPHPTRRPQRAPTQIRLGANITDKDSLVKELYAGNEDAFLRDYPRNITYARRVANAGMISMADQQDLITEVRIHNSNFHIPEDQVVEDNDYTQMEIVFDKPSERGMSEIPVRRGTEGFGTAGARTQEQEDYLQQQRLDVEMEDAKRRMERGQRIFTGSDLSFIQERQEAKERGDD